MNRKFLWHSFTDSRRPSAVDQRLERQAQQMGASYPSSPMPSPSRSRKTSGKGGGKKRCVKGDSCGAACIYHDDDCLKEFPPAAQESLRSVASMLQKHGVSQEDAEKFLDRLATKSKSEEEGSEEVYFPKARVEEFKNSLGTLKEKYTKNGVLDEKEYGKLLDYIVPLAVQASLTEREKNAPPSPEELEAIQKRKSQLQEYDKVYKEVEKRKLEGNPMSPEELRDKLRPLAEQRRIEVPPEGVNLFVAMLPESERNYLRQAGALEKSPNGGRFEPGSDIYSVPSNHGPLAKQGAQYADSRMRMLAAIYCAEGGRDFSTGMRTPITHCDLEHNIPAEIGGLASDQPTNMAFFRSVNNMGRGSKLYMSWWEAKVKRENLEFDENGNLTPKSKSRAQEKFDQTWAKINLKNDIEGRAARAQNAETLRALYHEIKQEDDIDLQRKLFTKLIAFNMGVAETVGGGIQSHGRGDKRWYWLGSDTNKSEQVSTQIIEKMLNLYENNDQEGMKKFREIMGTATSRLKAEVARRVTPDPQDIDPETGKPFVRVRGERGKQVRAIVTEIRDQILLEVLAI